VRKYVCDNCGSEFSLRDSLFVLRWDNLELLGEYCADCKAKIEAQIKEGVN